ncbi:MAG TPA: trypsin-like peptidase domain-containing protein [Flavobacteriales bacterium]
MMPTTRMLGGLCCAAALLLFNACASMLNPGKGSVQVNSEPSGATVLINGAEVGLTPYTLSYVKDMGKEVTVEVRKEGYQPRTVAIRATESGGVLFADAMLLGIPYIFDGRSDALYKFAYTSVDVSLYKALPEDLQRVDLPVAPMENAIGGGRLGKVGSRTIDLSSKEAYDLKYPDMATASVIRGFQGSWLDARGVRLGTTKGDEQVQRAKFYLRPRVKGVRIDTKEKDHLANGSVEVDMEWVFHSAIRKDSVLFKVEQTTRHLVFGTSPRELITVGVEAAARRLLEDPTLNERLLAAYGAGLQMAKGTELNLPRPVPIAFNGRKEMLAALVKGVVTVETKNGHGSGFLVTNDGYILTNAHVVENDALVKVRFHQGFALDGQVVKVNRDFDVALIKTPGADLPSLAIGDDAGLMLGEEIFAIGTPLDEKLGQSVTRGIMSGRREIEGRSYLQTDVSINPGNSGGPLIDENGKVVGVATLKISAKGVEGIGFGVPISKALEMLNIRFAQ